MPRIVIPFAMICTLLLLAGCERAAPPEDMLAQATAHVEQAEQAGSGDFVLALQQLELADNRLQQLLDTHRQSELVQDLREGDTTVGPYTLAELRERVIPRARERVRIQREGDLFDIALYLAEGLPDETAIGRAAMQIGAAIQYTGDTARALEVARRYGQASVEMDALLEARELAAGGNYKAALEALEALEDPTRRAASRLMIGEMMASEGHYESALEVLDEAEPHLDFFRPVFRALARAYATAGNYDKALEYGRHAGDNAQTSDTLIEIAMILNEQGDSDNAPEAWEAKMAGEVLAETREVIEAMTNEQYRAEYLAVLAHASADGGDHEQATRWFDEARAQAETIESSRMRHESLGVIAFRLAGAGFEELALELLEDATRRLQEEDAAAFIQAELRPFEVYANLGDFDTAMRKLLEIESRALYMDGLSNVAIAMSEQDAQSTEKQRVRLLLHGRHLESSR